MIDRQRLLARFLRYVQIDTTANDRTQQYPSSPGQWDLGRLLADELLEMGLQEVQQDEHGLVWATLPTNVSSEVPTIAWNAHLDTSPETTGAHVRPQVVRDYSGDDLTLPGDRTQVIRVAENPELRQLIGATLITTNGTTLLGADDKAGVAVIMEAISCLVETRDLPHGRIRVLFTCDEEIGRGTDFVDLERLGAAVAYTLDGPAAGKIDVESFSADLAEVRVRGVNIHPAIAKDRMVNAVRAGASFLTNLPWEGLSPETTEGRAGFLHPYQVYGGVDQVLIKILLRDFDTRRLDEYRQQLEQLARQTERQWPGTGIEVVVQNQYRNLADGLAREPRAVDYAQQAWQRLGKTAELTIIRGGTDGSKLTEKGLPTPNLSTGQHNPHSRLEWACLDEMQQACQHLIQLARVWAELSLEP